MNTLTGLRTALFCLVVSLFAACGGGGGGGDTPPGGGTPPGSGTPPGGGAPAVSDTFTMNFIGSPGSYTETPSATSPYNLARGNHATPGVTAILLAVNFNPTTGVATDQLDIQIRSTGTGSFTASSTNFAIYQSSASTIVRGTDFGNGGGTFAITQNDAAIGGRIKGSYDISVDRVGGCCGSSVSINGVFDVAIE